MYDKDKTILIRASCVYNFIIPDSVTTISKYCFSTEKIFNYGTVIFPNNVQTINSGALNEAYFDSFKFADDSKLTNLASSIATYGIFGSVTIPKSCITISQNAFANSNISSIEFQEESKLVTISSNVFYCTTGLKEINLPDSVTTIESNAFQSSELETLHIGSKCSSISLTAFSDCSSLTTVTIDSGNTNYKTVDGCIISSDKQSLIFITEEKESLSIPQEVTGIATTILQLQSNLKEIALQSTTNWQTSSGVLYKSNYETLYAVCGGVTSVTVDSHTKTIQSFAFCRCSKIKTVEFAGDSYNSFGSYSFSSTSLERFNIPASVTTLSLYAFAYCSLLTEITISDGCSLTTIQEGCFCKSAIRNITIPVIVTTLALTVFQSTYNLQTIIFADESKVSILSESLFRYSSLETITIPKSVTQISLNCFKECVNLTTVTFQDNFVLTSIGESAFQQCLSLERIELPSSCTSIGSSSFKLCSKLSLFSHSLQTISSSAFSECQSIQSFAIGPNLTTINPSAFRKCFNFMKFTVTFDDNSDSSVTNNQFTIINGTLFSSSGFELLIYPTGRKVCVIPAETQSLSSTCFTECTILEYVSAESKCAVKEFSDSLFINCASLRGIQFPYALEKIGSNCFLQCTKLSVISLPTTITDIGERAFGWCTSLKIVKYCGSKPITNTNVFPDTLKSVSVSPIYASEKLCDKPALTELLFDCEYVHNAKGTCNVRRPITLLSQLGSAAMISMYSSD